MRVRISLVASLLLVLVAACAGGARHEQVAKSAPTSEASSEPLIVKKEFEGDYRLGSGDRIKIRVFGEEDLSGEFEVDGNGEIAMPLVGTIQAKNMTSRDVEERIREMLVTGYLVDPKISVEVLSYRPFYIIGEVKVPGSYPYVNRMTVLNAVAMAGGYTYRAREDFALIKRTSVDGKVSEYKLDPVSVVFPGDVITIKERYF